VPKARALNTDADAVDMLRKATAARSAGLRAKYATRGLAHSGADSTTQAMLLRQLYLAHMEGSRFEDALAVATRMIETGVMPDVAQQDAARAHLGLDQTENALAHLRTASRVSPASRRAFHLWTLGSALYLMGRPRDAAGILGRASRWGTTARPLYAAQLALARLASGEQIRGLGQLRERLEDAPCGQGYGQFVLGDLAYHLGDFEDAKRYLEGFVERTSAGRVALAVSLRAEILHSKKLLKAMKQR
jgi:tetratricopeptide (TPR) repeat protein